MEDWAIKCFNMHLVGHQKEKFSPEYEVLFDDGWFQIPPEQRVDIETVEARPYALGCFENLKIKFASFSQIHKATGGSRLFSKVKWKLNQYFHTKIRVPGTKDFWIEQKENYSFFQSELLSHLNEENLCCYTGYWQNERYFQNISDKLREEFSFDHNYDDFNNGLVRKITSEPNSVALHIRGGDYKKLGWQIPFSYYSKAIEQLECKCSDCHYFVFGDKLPEETKDKHGEIVTTGVVGGITAYTGIYNGTKNKKN